VCVFFILFVYVTVCSPRPITIYIFCMHMVRCGLFVLKVSLNTYQPTKQEQQPITFIQIHTNKQFLLINIVLTITTVLKIFKFLNFVLCRFFAGEVRRMPEGFLVSIYTEWCVTDLTEMSFPYISIVQNGFMFFYLL